MTETRADAAGPFRKYEYAGAYHYALMERDPFYAAKIHKALALVRPGAVVLDIGCGDGVFLKYAAARGARVLGIDASAEGLLLARRMAGAQELCIAAAQQLPFASACLDLVVMIDVVNYLADCERAIAEAARVLRPGGTLLMMSPFDVSLAEERAAIADSWQVHAWTVDALRSLTAKYLRVAPPQFIDKVAPTKAIAALARPLRAVGALDAARAIVSRVRGQSSRSAAVAGPATVAADGDVTLDTVGLPRLLARRREKLEFILLATREPIGA